MGSQSYSRLVGRLTGEGCGVKEGMGMGKRLPHDGSERRAFQIYRFLPPPDPPSFEWFALPPLFSSRRHHHFFPLTDLSSKTLFLLYLFLHIIIFLYFLHFSSFFFFFDACFQFFLSQLPFLLFSPQAHFHVLLKWFFFIIFLFNPLYVFFLSIFL